MSAPRTGSTNPFCEPLGLRHAADVRSLATVGIAVGLLVAPGFFAIPAWAVPAWIVVTVIACCASHVVVHNHCHCPLFAAPARNRAFNLVATIARGHCASDVFLAHNVNHHNEQGRAGDWVTPALGGDGRPGVRLLRFVVRATLSMARERRRLGAAGRALVPEPFRSSLPVEKRLLPCVIGLLLWNDCQATVLHAVVPWGVSLVWLVGVNYLQHEGCDPDSAWAHSRNFTGALANWLLFNNGYHGAHHLHPTAHWSELARLHAEISDRIPTHLQQPSTTRYLLHRFVLNRST